MNKKVLIILSGGVPRVYAEHGIDAVCIDLDDSKVMDTSDMIPVHTRFGPLMDFAGVTGAWPISNDGRIDDADHIDASKLPEVFGDNHVC